MRRLLLLGALAAALPACAPAIAAGPAGAAPRRLPPVSTLVHARPDVVGMAHGLDAELDSIMRAGIAAGAAPGAELVVARYGRVVELRGFGHLDTTTSSPVPDESTLWDLASLTKVVATTTAAMLLEQDGLLQIDRPVHDYLPDFDAPDKAAITVRMLLEHRAGLEAGADLWRSDRGRAAYLAQINARPLLYPPGDSTVYSDWDFVLLGLVVERLSGLPLDRFVQQRVFGPLGMLETGFNPLAGGLELPADSDCTAALGYATAATLARIAPTEVDTEYRHMHLRGLVHDPNACALGGVAGHAGLFSSARDLAIFAQMMLNGGDYDGVRVLDPEEIAVWTARQRPGSSRALGWDTPSGSSSSGMFFSTRAFGHTGYTGTSLWLDPERGLFVILLTNRVNPTARNTRHEALRRAVANAVQEAILDAPLIDWQARRR
jgi:CubicO group peptidase (beta-lactamase class C family)